MSARLSFRRGHSHLIAMSIRSNDCDIHSASRSQPSQLAEATARSIRSRHRAGERAPASSPIARALRPRLRPRSRRRAGRPATTRRRPRGGKSRTSSGRSSPTRS
jgi:hypothetical protein